MFKDNKIYCPECLCGECFVPLQDGKWVMKDGKKVCLDCHSRTLCTRCEKVLDPNHTFTVGMYSSSSFKFNLPYSGQEVL